MSTKYKNTKKKMASLGLKKDSNGDYVYIDPMILLQSLYR